MSKDTNSSGKRTRRSFSDEFKRDAVNLVVVQGYSFKRATEALGVCPTSLRGWHDKFAPAPETCGDDATLEQVREENRRLRRQLKEAQLERAILKKATAFFAQESQ